MLTFSSFVLLVAGVQGASPNLLASPVEQSNELTGMGARRALEKDLSVFQYVLDFNYEPLDQYMNGSLPTIAFLSAAGTTVLMVMKLFFLKKGGVTKFATNIIVAAAAFINGFSSTRETLRQYKDTDESVKNLIEWLKANPIANATRFSAGVANFFVLVMALVGYNTFVTYVLAVASFALTSFGNWEAIKSEVLCSELVKKIMPASLCSA